MDLKQSEYFVHVAEFKARAARPIDAPVSLAQVTEHDLVIPSRLHATRAGR